ncbi:MAG TPA: hypothetical protein VNZ58_07420 [Thermomicrobiales bacterium]|nr:hypothetical protein [Thermomicrobiales bacterium]
MTTFTTIEQIEELMGTRSDLYVRWSHGPEADAQNNWISKNYAGTWDEVRGDYDYIPVDEIGLSALALDSLNAITRYEGEVHGTVCYVMAAREVDRCSDGDPLVDSVEPIAIIAPELISTIRNA